MRQEFKDEWGRRYYHSPYPHGGDGRIYINEKEEAEAEAQRSKKPIEMEFYGTPETLKAVQYAFNVPSNPKNDTMSDVEPVNFLSARKTPITEEHPDLPEAYRMYGMGATPAEIWRKTGLFRNSEGRWLNETADDITFRMRYDQIKRDQQYKLGDLLNYPALFDAVPELNDMDIIVAGEVDPKIKAFAVDGGIVLNSAVFDPKSDASPHEVLIHEIRHLMQFKERTGFLENTLAELQQTFLPYRSHPRESEAFMTAARYYLDSDERKLVPPMDYIPDDVKFKIDPYKVYLHDHRIATGRGDNDRANQLTQDIQAFSNKQKETYLGKK